MASNDAPHKELENFSNSLEKISTYLFNDDHDKFTEQVFNDLEEKNKSFIFYSNFNNSHANFIKYSKENNQYYRTFYNVGSGDIESENQSIKKFVSGAGFLFQTKKILVGGKSEIQKKIKQDLVNNAKGVNNEPDELLKNQPFEVSDVQVKEQRYNNCSTRALREALRDNIPTEEFRELYEFIANNSYSDMLKAAGIEKSIKQEEIKDFESALKKYIQLQRKKFDMAQTNLKKEEDNELTQKYNNLKIEYAEIVKKIKELKAQLPESQDKINIRKKVKELLSQQGKLLDQQHKVLNQQEQLSQNPTNTSLNMKNHISNFRDQGFNILTKQQLLNETATQYSEKLDKERSQNLWLKLFKESLNDIDLPLTKELLEPVKRHFSNCLNKSSDDNEIFNEWKKECIEDLRIDPIIKAPIIKSMIENKEDLPKSIKHYAKSDNAKIKNLTVNDIYKNLLKENIAQRDINAAHRQQDMKESNLTSEQLYKKYLKKEASKKTLDDIKKTLDSHLTKKHSSINIVPNFKKQESNKSNTR
ncbi:hypothetical protein RBEMOGI_1351 [Rickettsia bellii str. RML Mogi]|uniref:Uncharacterized protein n=2 Tax=Rickettsia bellii TaxID=33990 RepID=A0A0F3QKP7_RICBE|nr:hypothetical protein RBEMOGI_1351 [Rickettsia bellii str. RML Mogi]